MSALLEIREVSKSFGGVQAVNRVSLDVNEGDLLSVIGPNGAGKTTLLNMISGFYHPDSGRSAWRATTSPTSPRAASPSAGWPAPSRTSPSSGA